MNTFYVDRQNSGVMMKHSDTTMFSSGIVIPTWILLSTRSGGGGVAYLFGYLIGVLIGLYVFYKIAQGIWIFIKESLS